jgi:hypothetical protein
MTWGEERVSDERASTAKESREIRSLLQKPISEKQDCPRGAFVRTHAAHELALAQTCSVVGAVAPATAAGGSPGAPSSALERASPTRGRGDAATPGSRAFRASRAAALPDASVTLGTRQSSVGAMEILFASIRRCRRWNPGRDGRASRPIATRERRRDFLGRARRCPSRACRGRVHADPRVSGEETLRVRCSIPIKSLSRFGNNARVAFALARRARASFGRAQARTWRPKPWSWRRPFY